MKLKRVLMKEFRQSKKRWKASKMRGDKGGDERWQKSDEQGLKERQISKFKRYSTKKNIKVVLGKLYIKSLKIKFRLVHITNLSIILIRQFYSSDGSIYDFKQSPIDQIQFPGVFLQLLISFLIINLTKNMRLNVPPTLKQSSLIDSHSLSGVGLPINLNSRGLKRSSKVFREDDNTSFGDDMTIGEMITTNSKKQTSNLLPPEFVASMQRKRSIDFQQDAKINQASFLKRMPLFNHYQQQSNLSQIKLSQIAKKQLDYQEDFNEQELPAPLPNRQKRKSSSGDLQESVDRSSEVLTKGLKRLKSIDTINEESSSSPGNSLKGSRKMQQKSQLGSSLRRTNPKTSQQAFQLQPIQQYNRQKHGIAQSSNSQSRTNQSSARITRQIQQIKTNQMITMTEVQSQRQMTHSNPSNHSCQTVNLRDEDENSVGRSEVEHQKDNKIRQKMKEIQKSFNEYSVWDGTEVEPSVSGLRFEVVRSERDVPLQDSDKRLLTNINERYQKIKEIKYGKSETPQQNKLKQSVKKVTFKTDQLSTQQKSTQTDSSFNNDKFPDSTIKQLSKRYSDQIQILQKQNARLHKQSLMDSDTTTCLQKMKLKYQEENKFLLQKIKRLQRILEKNENELAEWKEFAKEGRVEPSEAAKDNKIIKEINLQWRQKEDKYLGKISELQKQLLKTKQLLNNPIPTHSSTQNSTKAPKPDHQKYYQHIQKLHHYQQNLKRNMQIIRKQQQKIIHQWRLIDQFHKSLRQQSHNSNEKYQYQTIGKREEQQTNYGNMVSFGVKEENYWKDNDVASISAKLKSMRVQLAKNSR